MNTRAGCLLFLLLAQPLGAQPPAAPAVRTPVAKVTSPAATFAARPAADKPFEVLPTGAELRTGDLLVAMPGAALESKDGAVSVKSFADYDNRSPLPILETAVVLTPPEKDEDFAFTLDRGRVDVTNQKARGAVVVGVRFADQKWVIKLEEPGSRAALELSGRWPAGARFTPAEPKPPAKPAAPIASFVLLVLNGSVQVTSGGTTLGMRAPPGPAMLTWDSVEGAVAQPMKLTALPEWADPTVQPSARAKKVAEVVEKFRAARAEKPDAALKQFLESTDPIEQRVALVTLGAQDDLVTLGESLAAAKTLEEWDFGITVARHWLGRGPGQDQKLYQRLMAARGYSAAQAQIVMQLLFGFSAAQLKLPETYQVLIDYLAHEKSGIRNLAAWHLVRLVPQGRDIPYKPNGTVAEAVKSQEAWKKLVPSGELPPPPPKK
jgi:hypothetical protein